MSAEGAPGIGGRSPRQNRGQTFSSPTDGVRCCPARSHHATLVVDVGQWGTCPWAHLAACGWEGAGPVDSGQPGHVGHGGGCPSEVLGLVPIQGPGAPAVP